MKTGHCILCVVLAVGMASCTAGEKKKQQREEELIAADLAFSAMSVERGMNHAFLTYCAQEGVLLRPDRMPVTGITLVGELLEQNDDAAFELSWKPLHARVAQTGDLGYTYGTYTLRLEASGQESRGTYVSIWVRENGSWKWILDSGNQGLGE
jgi:hypothetical protein